MRIASNFLRSARKSLLSSKCSSTQSRNLITLAIETSCDDTSVAILEKNDAAAVLHFHEKITADNSQYRGIHPIASLDSHQGNLAKLVNKAIASLPRAAHGIPGALTTIERSGEEDTDMDSGSGSMLANGVDVKKPDFISVTRGPGMRSSLSAGLDLAKGLAVAWQVPLVGVNHMQAHALTPRLVSALDQRTRHPVAPAFPFLSLLVSGGHTLLVHSQDLIQHKILASTTDIAVGEAIDKMARTILPDKLLEESRDTMYGPLIERFAFPGESSEYNYTAPVTREKELARKPSSWGWAYGPPLAETKKGSRAKAMEFSFSGLASATERFVQKADHEVTLPERVDLSKEAMRVSFEHLASRVVMGLNNMKRDDPIAESAIRTLVVSGGVASNQYLKVILRSFLDVRGYPHIQLAFPPPLFCTDNAAMIGWTGIEMFANGWESDLGCRALRKWSMDPDAEDGGILGASNWMQRVR